MNTGAKVALGVGAAAALGLLAWAVWPKPAAAPAPTPPPPTPPPASGGSGGGALANGPLVFAGPSDNGTTKTVPVGTTLVISLPQDPSTGATWSGAASGAPLQTLPDIVVPAIPPNVPAHVFSYLAVRPGSASVVLQQFAGDGSIAQLWRIDVTVPGVSSTGGSASSGGGSGVHFVGPHV